MAMQMRIVGVAIVVAVFVQSAHAYLRENGSRVVPYSEEFYIELPPMKPGEVLFSIPQTPQMFMPMPSLASEGKQVAVVNMHNVIVEAYNTSFVLNEAKDNWDEADMREVPLSQLYNHHWIAVDFSLPRYTSNEGVYGEMLAAQDKSFANGPCEGLKFSYGGGSEMSTTPTEFAEPYAFVLRGDEYFGLNLHVIDLRGVPDSDLQSCVQCECEYLNRLKYGDYETSAYKYPIEGGGAQCCIGGMQCSSTLPDEDTKQYYFKYRMRYKEYEPGVDVPLYSSLFSASSDAASVCHIEFNPPMCSSDDHGEGPERDHTFGSCVDDKTAIIEYDWQVNSDIDVIFSSGHAHIGSTDGVIATVLEPVTTTKNQDGDDVEMRVERELCHSKPTFGGPGDLEEGFLTSMTTCDHMLPSNTTSTGMMPTRIDKGSILRIAGHYNGQPTTYNPDVVGNDQPANETTVKFPAPYHGSMVYYLLYYVFSSTEKEGYSQFGDVPEDKS